MARSVTHVVVVSRLQSRLAQLIEQLDELAQAGTELAGSEPALDLVTTPGGYRLILEVPGVPASRLQVLHRGTQLTVIGDRGKGGNTGRYRCVERQRGRIERTVRLPRDADPDNATARLESGLLAVELPRRSSAYRGREIPIHEVEE